MLSSGQVEVASFTDQLGGVPLEMLNLRRTYACTPYLIESKPYRRSIIKCIAFLPVASYT